VSFTGERNVAPGSGARMGFTSLGLWNGPKAHGEWGCCGRATPGSAPRTQMM
jgi:hypothetical protein